MHFTDPPIIKDRKVSDKTKFMQMIKWKIVYLNCGERYEDMTDHGGYAPNLNSCKIEAWKKFKQSSVAD